MLYNRYAFVTGNVKLEPSFWVDSSRAVVVRTFLEMCMTNEKTSHWLKVYRHDTLIPESTEYYYRFFVEPKELQQTKSATVTTVVTEGEFLNPQCCAHCKTCL